MESLITSLTSFLEWLQMPAQVGAAIAFCIAGYYLMWGGDQGRGKAVKWLVGGAGGLLVVMGALSLANSVSENISF